jgi:type II secretory pathway pseudopilin PulG
MKLVRFHRGSRSTRGGFNLVEATITLGIMSIAFLTLAPLMGMGLKSSRWARDDRLSAEIARTFVEEAKQGAPPASPAYLDDQGAACAPQNAAFVVQSVTQAAGNSASQLTLRVTPVGAPKRARVYAIVLPVAAEN